MASNSVSLQNETAQIIDFDPESISRCLRQHLQEAPLAWMMIHGSHSIRSQQTSPPEQAVDFALKIKGMNAQLLGVEVRSIENNSKVFSMDRSAHNSTTLDEEIIQKCCQAVIDLPNRGSYQGIIVEKDTAEVDPAVMQRFVRVIASRVAYGGNIDVTFHDTTSLTSIQSQTIPAERPKLSIKSSWIHEWPGSEARVSTPTDMQNSEQRQKRQKTWSGRLQAAMVDNENGWIAKDEPVPPGIQITRALNKYNLVHERTEHKDHYENGVKVGSSERVGYHRWGCDE